MVDFRGRRLTFDLRLLAGGTDPESLEAADMSTVTLMLSEVSRGEDSIEWKCLLLGSW